MKKLLLIALLISGCIETDLQSPLPESLRIVLSGESFRVGGTYQLQSEFVNSDGIIEEADVVWTSSDANVFSINGSTGAGVSEGSVMLTASFNGLEATEEIEIESSKASLEITMFVSQLQVGNNFNMGVNYINVEGNPATANVIWTSSDLSVATISSDGLVSALEAGVTTIRASSGGLTDELTLTVVDEVVMVDPEVRFVQFVEELSVGEMALFEAGYFGTDGMLDDTQSITWSSSDSGVLTIDAGGNATGIAEGSVVLEASANGLSAQLSITVLPVEATVRTGSLMGTGYDISGDFTLAYNEFGDLILNITNYESDGPGPYFYLTNQTNSIANGLNLGDASSNGVYVLNISNIARDAAVDDVELFTYGVLMVWCEPFGVRLGFGEFDN